RAAVAGLRKLRPVQEFRGTRRRIPRRRARAPGDRANRRETLMVSRVDRRPVANWWWTIDRWFFAAFLLLMGLGIVLSFAASPAVAERIGLDSYHFITRQMIFMVPAVLVMIAVSFFEARHVRRLALLMLAGSLVLMVAALYFGVEIK